MKPSFPILISRNDLEKFHEKMNEAYSDYIDNCFLFKSKSSKPSISIAKLQHHVKQNVLSIFKHSYLGNVLVPTPDFSHDNNKPYVMITTEMHNLKLKEEIENYIDIYVETLYHNYIDAMINRNVTKK